MSGIRILVTGGAGFIGSHYVRTLLGPGGDPEVELTVLDALTYAGSAANLREVSRHPRLTFVHGDIRDTQRVRDLVAGHDHIVHFAAESHVDRSIADADGFVTTNVMGTQKLLEAAKRSGVRTFVHVSTDEVYGSVPVGSAPECAPLAPTSPYAASKASSDLMALAYWRTHGLDVRITRCSNNYGPYQHPEKLIPRFVTRLLSGLPVPLYGDGRQIRDWLHVDDHIQAIELVRTHGRAGDVYNIGGGTTLTNSSLTEMLLGICGRGWEMVEHVADRNGHDLRYAVDDSKIREELGYHPRQEFTTGLQRTVDWYRENPQLWKGISEGAV